MPRAADPGTLQHMSFPDADAAHLHAFAIAALQRGDAVGALDAVAGYDDAAASRLAGRALLALGDLEGARRALTTALADAADDPRGQALAHAALASVARAMGEPIEAIGHLEWALMDTPESGRAALHREAATIASRAGLLADAEFHARAALDLHATTAVQAAGAAGGRDEDELALPGPRTLAEDRARLGAILAAQGRHREALDHLRTATDWLAAALGDGHAETLRARAELAEALGESGDAAAAVTEHEAVLAGRAAALGSEHPELAPTLLALAELIGGAGTEDSQAAAHRFAVRAVAVLQGRVAADHPLLAEAQAAATAWAR